MRRHKVVTVERQGGYAARCEDCDAITFGGHETRSAARESLRGHEEREAPAVASGRGETETTPGATITMNTTTATPDIAWNRPDWDRLPAGLEERVDKVTATGEDVITFASEYLVDGDRVSVDVTREDICHLDGTITEGPLQINVWAGGNPGFVVDTAQQLLQVADELREAAKKAAALLANDAGRNTFEIRSRYLPSVTELHVIRRVDPDGTERLDYVRSPLSHPEHNIWSEADVARPGEWWEPTDIDTGKKTEGRRIYVARVRKVDGFDDLWEEIDPTPLEGYKGKRPKNAQA